MLNDGVLIFDSQYVDRLASLAGTYVSCSIAAVTITPLIIQVVVHAGITGGVVAMEVRGLSSCLTLLCIHLKAEESIWCLHSL